MNTLFFHRSNRWTIDCITNFLNRCLVASTKSPVRLSWAARGIFRKFDNTHVCLSPRKVVWNSEEGWRWAQFVYYRKPHLFPIPTPFTGCIRIERGRIYRGGFNRFSRRKEGSEERERGRKRERRREEEELEEGSFKEFPILSFSVSPPPSTLRLCGREAEGWG